MTNYVDVLEEYVKMVFAVFGVSMGLIIIKNRGKLPTLDDVIAGGFLASGFPITVPFLLGCEGWNLFNPKKSLIFELGWRIENKKKD
jgi:hypothetical protein